MRTNKELGVLGGLNPREGTGGIEVPGLNALAQRAVPILMHSIN